MLWRMLLQPVPESLWLRGNRLKSGQRDGVAKMTAHLQICVGGDDSVSSACRSFFFPAWLTDHDHMTRLRARLSLGYIG